MLFKQSDSVLDMKNGFVRLVKLSYIVLCIENNIRWYKEVNKMFYNEDRTIRCYR